MLHLAHISKSYRVAKRGKGVGQAFQSLFRREYTVVEALKDISFEVGEGELVGYIGPNGAGKSTSIKIMSGILVPDSGECRIMGYNPWRDRKDYVRNIGVVFGQRTQLWWDVPVVDSFELLRDIYNVEDTEYRKNLSMLSDALELQNLLNTPLRQLSLGQRMRCELAASLLHSPRLLFLDEPTIGLDAVSKLAVRSFIKTVNRERGVTCILTTHDMNDIEALTDRILLIGKGHILHDGSLGAIRNRYDTSRTLTVQFRGGEAPEIPGAKLISKTAERAVYRLDAVMTSVAEALTRLGEGREVIDVTVENRPVEEIIAELYREYHI